MKKSSLNKLRESRGSTDYSSSLNEGYESKIAPTVKKMEGFANTIDYAYSRGGKGFDKDSEWLALSKRMFRATISIEKLTKFVSDLEDYKSRNNSYNLDDVFLNDADKDFSNLIDKAYKRAESIYWDVMNDFNKGFSKGK